MRIAVVLILAAITTGADSPHRRAPRVTPNDNRVATGTLRDGVLTLRLEARLGSWHPDGDAAPGADVPAFAEAGKAPSIPGPLVRVPSGTVVSVALHNQLADSVEVHGLVDRTAFATAPRDPGEKLGPGETRTIRFRLDAPGTYYYWGTTTGRPFRFRTLQDAQLTGAIVVDPPGHRAADRVMVVGMWTDTVARAYTERKRLLAVVNGRAWPNTERLRYSVGDTARWRVINASADAHPMHLHGFYFRVDSRGDGLVDTVYAPGAGDRVFTETMAVGGTYTSSWVPERAGNWLFHCHIAEHFARRGALGAARPAPSPDGHHATNHALEGMGGLVMGIEVRPARGTPVARAIPGADERRHLRLLVRRNVGGSDVSPFLGFALQQGAAATPADSGLHFGPPLVLTRGEPVSIMVVNGLSEPTAVHWHGIELESYFDGVAGFSGDGRRTSPAIAPGDSFEARFTPPRAGTFIYHSHVEEEKQLLGGLAGALIVLEPGQRFDPATDHVVLLTSPTSFADQQRGVLVVGPTPGALELRAGLAHRLRFINMTLRRPVLAVDLLRDSVQVGWSLVAKDAIPLAPPIRSPAQGRRTVGIGETLDFEVPPQAPGELRLDVRIGGSRPPFLPMGSLPVHVVP